MPDPALSALARTISIDALRAAFSGADSAGTPLILLDIRPDHGGPSGSGAQDGFAAYQEAHIPGARYVNLGRDLADPEAEGRGANPLPRPEAMRRLMAQLGIGAESPVVLSDAGGGGAAARGWWVLGWMGLRNLHLLEGGLAAWRARGLPVESGPGPARKPGGAAPDLDAPRPGGPFAHLDAEALLRAPPPALLDARPAESFRAQGHIPGALSLPAASLLDAEGALRPEPELAALLAETGAPGEGPLVVSCGGGVAACLLGFALMRLGREVILHPGSWSEWVADPARPVER